MLITCISDMHGQYRALNLPDSDVIVCTGDLTGRGSEYEFKDFLEWFSSLKQYDRRIFIAGNHDESCEQLPENTRALIPENVDYLFDSFIIHEGVKFYGTPYQPVFFDWAFNVPEEQLMPIWDKIPHDTNVLLTHCPPYGILDKTYNSFGPSTNVGSISLYRTISDRLNLKLHVFGHIHEAYGYEMEDGTAFVNASNMNRRYELVNNPKVILI